MNWPVPSVCSSRTYPVSAFRATTAAPPAVWPSAVETVPRSAPAPASDCARERPANSSTSRITVQIEVNCRRMAFCGIFFFLIFCVKFSPGGLQGPNHFFKIWRPRLSAVHNQKESYLCTITLLESRVFHSIAGQIVSSHFGTLIPVLGNIGRHKTGDYKRTCAGLSFVSAQMGLLCDTMFAHLKKNLSGLAGAHAAGKYLQ